MNRHKAYSAYSDVFQNTRELAKFINEHKLDKDDILSVLPIGGQIFMIYYA